MSKWLEALVMTRPPKLLHTLLPGCEWTAAPAVVGAPVIYLTFDDGPIPDETPWVLEQLAQFDARATFFCVGDNVARYPEIARAALAAGHRLGNHTQHHRSAWQVTGKEYLSEVSECQQGLRVVFDNSDDGVLGVGDSVLGQSVPPTPNTQHPVPNTQSQATTSVFSASLDSQPLFRPPYGRLTRSLIQALKSDYRIIMWSVLTRDYDPDLAPEKCLRQTLAAMRPGDIVVFHDSRKASARLRYVLPRVLAHFAGRGFRFETL
ncbi:polysaccharide deacetylase family protein [Hymenobacter sp. ASUV-10]|uniref:Polysaccharide deacetylase family protein n=1 Tax=Hymenobacter aranciens TaxID=3063996 RepID=A0ABT9BG56_9BACT|nr:polysaccharide deacetylase family protein [Hymenobacter sp. ASUV-10]MDO7875636.1 polysaccharide deacetylase family protein [Hymenobacter sp. ASUV-10]